MAAITRKEFLELIFWGCAGLLALVFLPAKTRSRAFASSDLYDDFQGSLYSLADGDTSPNGKWYCDYAGLGCVRTIITSTATRQHAMQEKPMVSTSSEETHACLVTSTSKYSDLELRVRMRTRKQLRTGSKPNPWECAWLMWRYIDQWHHYYFILKPNGIEIGKKDNDKQAEEQIFLYTASSPKLTLDSWSNIKIRQIDDRIRVWRGSSLIADFVDSTMSETLAKAGAAGLYCEDALVQFDNVYIFPSDVLHQSIEKHR